MDKLFTYSGDPSRSDRDAVRFLTGDTVKERVLFDDREINWQLTRTPNIKIASHDLLMAKAAEYSTKADIKVGDVSKAYSKVAENMRICAMELKKDALNSVLPFFGGLTISGKQNLSERTNDIQPQFSVGMSDYPGASQLSDSMNALWGLINV